MKRTLVSPTHAWLMIGTSLLWLASEAEAQRVQDNWYSEPVWTMTQAMTNGGLSSPNGVAVGPDGRIYVGDSGFARIQVYLPDGTFSFGITNNFGNGESFSNPYGLITDTAGNLYVADSGRNAVFVFTKDGGFIRKIGGVTGSGNGELNGVRDVAVSVNGDIYVLEFVNARVSIFSSEGVFLRKWGGAGVLDGQLYQPTSIATRSGSEIYIGQQEDGGSGKNAYVKVFHGSGVFLRKWSCYRSTYALGLSPRSVRIDPSGLIIVGISASYVMVNPNREEYNPSIYFYDEIGSLIDSIYVPMYSNADTDNYLSPVPFVGVGPNGNVYSSSRKPQVFRHTRAFREQRTPPNNAIAMPRIVDKRQRSSSPLVDIDFEVTDMDDTNVTVGALIFTNSSATPSLAACIRNPAFVEGTSSNLGPNMAANQIHRLTWNAGADWSVNLGDYRVAILAQDSRTNLLDIHYLSLPADNGMPALKISRSPVGTADFMQVWWWLLATGDPGITLASNQIFGVSGTYAAQQLCTNGTTTPLGRSYICEKMHVREATAQEVQWAKQGNMPAGSSPNQWSAARAVAGRPAAVNEWGFDTGSWDTNAWKWVVPLP